MQHPKSNTLIAAIPLFLVLFIDGMGLGIVFPILNALIIDPSSGFLSPSISAQWHNVIYGAVIGVFMLSWFFGAAILGDSSDKIGRRKALLICLCGAALSYLLSAVAVMMHSLTLLFIGRVIAGLTAGSQPIAQAAIIDLSDETNKARNIGLILLSLSLGFIFGPLFGGVLIDKNLVSWFTLSTPLIFATLLAILNIILLIILFKETSSIQSTKIKIQWAQAIKIFASAFEHRQVRFLSILFFIFMLGWSSYYSFISVFLIKKYAFTPTEISYFLTLMGVGFGIGNGFLMQWFAKRFSLIASFLICSLGAALMVMAMLISGSSIICWLLIVPMASGIAIAYATAITLFSNQVDASQQGWVMGITGSIMAFVFGVDAFIGGFLASLSVNLPIILSLVSLLAAAIYAISLKHKHKINMTPTKKIDIAA